MTHAFCIIIINYIKAESGFHRSVSVSTMTSSCEDVRYSGIYYTFAPACIKASKVSKQRTSSYAVLKKKISKSGITAFYYQTVFGFAASASLFMHSPSLRSKPGESRSDWFLLSKAKSFKTASVKHFCSIKSVKI